MRIKRTWKNLAIALFILPIRIPLMLVPWAVSRVGEAAESFGRWVDTMLPGLEVDWTDEHTHTRMRKEMFKLTDIRQSNAPEPETH